MKVVADSAGSRVVARAKLVSVVSVDGSTYRRHGGGVTLFPEG